MIPRSSPKASIRRHLWLGGTVIFVLLGGFTGWAATAQLSGAVVAHGALAVDGYVKKVQHRDGGIVAAIHVRNGRSVKAGQLLMQLDDTVTRANLTVVSQQIDQLSARQLRLAAERDNTDKLTLPADLPVPFNAANYMQLLRSEVALFAARRAALRGQKQQLRERISQIAQEREGLETRRTSKDEELVLIAQELDGVAELYAKKLVALPRLIELRRNKAQISGERGQLTAEIARTATRITETELQILQLDQDRQEKVLNELRETESKLAELSEQRVASADQLKRVDIIAPQDGIVHELSVHTVGGVIAPAETVMIIVPRQDMLVVEARLLPQDIDQITPNQKAVLRFSAFNQRTTPEVTGDMQIVAADLSHNPQTGESWYAARITISDEEIAKLGNLPLSPGMPVEVFIRTGDRTALSYLTKPLTDQIQRAMRED
jgi:HlyD family secretion protein